MDGGVVSNGSEEGSWVESLLCMSVRVGVVGEVGLISLGSSTWFGGVHSSSSKECWVISVLLGGSRYSF